MDTSKNVSGKYASRRYIVSKMFFSRLSNDLSSRTFRDIALKKKHRLMIVIQNVSGKMFLIPTVSIVVSMTSQS